MTGMADRKPPRLTGSESEILRALLQYQRESLVRKVIGVDEDSARQSPVATATSLLWLLKHMTRAEVLWVVKRFAAEEAHEPADTVGPGDRVETAIANYRDTWARVDAIAFSGASLEESCRGDDGDPPVNLRWVLAHLLEETARHAGHADIIRELIDGETGR